jgi:hypothetical protein
MRPARTTKLRMGGRAAGAAGGASASVLTGGPGRGQGPGARIVPAGTRGGADSIGDRMKSPHRPLTPPLRAGLGRALLPALLAALAGTAAAGAAAPPAAAAASAPAAGAPAAGAEADPTAAAAVPEPAASAASAPAVPAAPLPAAPPAAPPAPPAFQGLPWGADEAQILARFGTRLQPAACDAALRVQAQRQGELCESPGIPRYEVAGVPFVLTLHLDAEARRLVRVTLVHNAEYPRTEEPRWSDNHRVMRRLLSQRYGGPEFTDLQHDAGVSTAVARWRTGPALIELSSTFQPRSGGSPAREQMAITYKSPWHGEASKL